MQQVSQRNRKRSADFLWSKCNFFPTTQQFAQPSYHDAQEPVGVQRCDTVFMGDSMVTNPSARIMAMFIECLIIIGNYKLEKVLAFSDMIST